MKNQSSIISFILDGRRVDIDFEKERQLSPTTTVLNYLRSLPDHKGTKEGCAEGDCGACTCVLADIETESAGLKHQPLSYTAIDSCLVFLPALQGKQLITVENLGSSTDLHPVQQAMVDTDGSQCGYCTPGFIMSMFALYKNHDKPSRPVIDDALTGNLCRCTGYRPIVEAAAQACVHQGSDGFSQEATQTVALLKEIQENAESFGFEGSDQQYFRPKSLKEALKLYQKHPEALIVHGGTDIGLLVTKQKKHLPCVLDISGLSELQTVEDSATHLTMGAGLSLEKVKSLSEKPFPALYNMLAVFGSLQIRNLSTLGGNLASSSPIGDTPPVLMAYDAIVIVEGLEGRREIPAIDFITGYRSNQVQAGELIVGVRIPKVSNGLKIQSYKISKRKDLDISTVSAGFRLDLSPDDTVRDIRLVYGGMAAMTKRAAKAEAFLKGKPWNRSTVEQALPLIDEEFTPISDARSGKEGRRVMARNLLLKFWLDTGAGA